MFDGYVKVDNRMTIENVNSLPPAFSSLPLPDQESFVGVPKTISLPSYSDPDGQTVTLSAFLNTADPLPSFMSIKNSNLEIEANSVVGEYTLNI